MNVETPEDWWAALDLFLEHSGSWPETWLSDEDRDFLAECSKKHDFVKAVRKCNQIWFELPDSRSIHGAAFYFLCDCCENDGVFYGR